MKKGRVLLSVLVIALAIAMIGGMTASLFTDDATVSSSFEAGTVYVEAGDVIPCPCVDFGNMKPGDTARGCFDVKNIGTLPFTFEVEFETDGDLFGGLHPAVVEITEIEEDELEPGETTTVCYTVTLPCEAGNEYKGVTGSLLFTVNATQILGSCGEEEPDTYTVTFMDGEEPYHTVSGVEKDATVDLPDDPTKDGFTFEGWFTASDDPFTENTPVTDNITVYAKWNAVVGNCTITVHASVFGYPLPGVGFSGGDKTTSSNSTVSAELPQGTEVTLIAPYQVQSYGWWWYTFDGWSTSPGGLISIDPNPWQWGYPPSTQYQYELNGNVDLYANYSIHP